MSICLLPFFIGAIIVEKRHNNIRNECYDAGYDLVLIDYNNEKAFCYSEATGEVIEVTK